MKYKVGNIYVLKNSINNKCYVGQTINSIKNRLKSHKHNKKSLLGLAIYKYGIVSFCIYEYRNIPIEYLDYFEIEMIKRLNCISPNGYNIHLGGQLNRIFSEKTKKKIGLGNKGKHRTEQWKINHSKMLFGTKKVKKNIYKYLID